MTPRTYPTWMCLERSLAGCCHQPLQTRVAFSRQRGLWHQGHIDRWGMGRTHLGRCRRGRKVHTHLGRCRRGRRVRTHLGRCRRGRTHRGPRKVRTRRGRCPHQAAVMAHLEALDPWRQFPSTMRTTGSRPRTAQGLVRDPTNVWVQVAHRLVGCSPASTALGSRT